LGVGVQYLGTDGDQKKENDGEGTAWYRAGGLPGRKKLPAFGVWCLVFGVWGSVSGAEGDNGVEEDEEGTARRGIPLAGARA